jgi:hypothetical protein
VTRVRISWAADTTSASANLTVPAYRCAIHCGSLPSTFALMAPVSGIAAANGSLPPSSIGVSPAALSFAHTCRNWAQVVGGCTPALANCCLL